MNNDEKILAMLTQMQADMSGMKSDMSGMQADMSSLNQRLTKMEVVQENVIEKKISLLIEGQQTILERLPDPDQINENTGRIDMLETVVRKHSMDIRKLQKAT